MGFVALLKNDGIYFAPVCITLLTPAIQHTASTTVLPPLPPDPDFAYLQRVFVGGAGTESHAM